MVFASRGVATAEDSFESVHGRRNGTQGKRSRSMSTERMEAEFDQLVKSVKEQEKQAKELKLSMTSTMKEWRNIGEDGKGKNTGVIKPLAGIPRVQKLGERRKNKMD